MAHPKDDEVYPAGTVVRRLKTGERATIKRPMFRYEGKYFSHYEAFIEGKGTAVYVLLHDEVEVVALP